MKNTNIIGITERGDAGIDFRWVKALDEGVVPSAVVITKVLNERMIEPLIRLKDKIILHITVTGYAKTILERNTPPVLDVYNTLLKLLELGFPKNHVVLRIDPIIPTQKGISKANSVMEQFSKEVDRVRVSVLDMYPHVAKRFKKCKIPHPYDGNFQASDMMFDALNGVFSFWENEYGIKPESCAEKKLTNTLQTGCVSKYDYELLGIELPEEMEKKQRDTCLCYAKKELLTGIACRCSNKCEYCYWKDVKNKDSEILISELKF